MKHKLTIGIGAALVLLTAIFAVIHLTSRTDVRQGDLLIEAAGEQLTVDCSSFSLEEIDGTLSNAKGETRSIHAQGIELSRLLGELSIAYSDCEQVKIIAADEYSAAVTTQEIINPGQVYLALQEDGSMQLIVFGDSNSKRNVTNVIRIVLE